jgi:hypothetical protein
MLAGNSWHPRVDALGLMHKPGHLVLGQLPANGRLDDEWPRSIGEDITSCSRRNGPMTGRSTAPDLHTTEHRRSPFDVWHWPDEGGTIGSGADTV